MNNPQNIAIAQFKDCMKRTKKKPPRFWLKGGFETTENLFRSIIEQSSILCDEGAHSYREVCEAVDVFQQFLCGGQWCIRLHCKNFSSWHAWNCMTTRPAVCKEFETYAVKKIKREHSDFKEDDVAEKELFGVFVAGKSVTCRGMYFDNNLKKYVCYRGTEETLFTELHKKKIDALMFFIRNNEGSVDYDVRNKIFENLKNKFENG